MHKVKSINWKIGATILLFSIIITATFVGLFFVFSRSDANGVATGLEPVGTYTLASADIQILAAEGYYTLTPKSISLIDDYNQSFLAYMLVKIIPYAIGFCLILFVMAILLWLTLNRIQTKNNLQIVKQIAKISSADSFECDNPELLQAYERIRQKFDDNLSDYKRLNSYLSHEQKNAIAILRTNLELSENTEYLSQLDYVSDSIDDVLTLSETDENALKAPVDVALVCAAVCDSYQAVQENIRFTFDENADTRIIAKERWIYRAVANLISNAVKYGDGKPIEVQVQNKKGSVIVTVKDYGIGIAAASQNKIFNHRYRINDLNKDGYGIGLSLVSHVCDLCGGFVTLESEEGKGTTFYLLFPENNPHLVQ